MNSHRSGVLNPKFFKSLELFQAMEEVKKSCIYSTNQSTLLKIYLQNTPKAAENKTLWVWANKSSYSLHPDPLTLFPLLSIPKRGLAPAAGASVPECTHTRFAGCWGTHFLGELQQLIPASSCLCFAQLDWEMISSFMWAQPHVWGLPWCEVVADWAIRNVLIDNKAVLLVPRTSFSV